VLPPERKELLEVWIPHHLLVSAEDYDRRMTTLPTGQLVVVEVSDDI
jgi:hypothetical protein